MKQKRVNFHIYCTQECNLRCKHCYSANNINHDNRLEIHQLKSIITVLNQHYDCYFDIEGGELFTRKDIGSLFMQLTKEQLNRITITTNGTILPDIGAAYLKELDDFRVSVEGHTDELHEDMRGIPLEKIMKNCEVWKRNGVAVTLRITLNRKNKDYIHDMITEFQKRDFHKFSFYEFQSVGRGMENAEDYSLEEEDIRAIIDEIQRVCQMEKGLETVKLSLARNRSQIVEQKQKELLNNGFGVEDFSDIPALTINYNGELGYCPWELTSHTCGFYERENFLHQIEHTIKEEQEHHDCQLCTAVRIQLIT